MIVSVVIPTFGRGERLGATLDALLVSDSGGLSEIEIVVVDDGSPMAVAPFVESRHAAPPFSLRCLRQENAGPAAARNHGFRMSRGEIVIFVDDDILCPPPLVRQHVEAHRANPGSVIFGRCPYVRPDPATPVFRYLESLGHDAGKDREEEYLRVDIVASGQLSVERRMFDDGHGVYRDDLATPNAEELELALRLRDRDIPIFLATRVVAQHDHAIKIAGLCRQAFKHSMGCAEVAVKYPRALEMSSLQDIIRVHGPAGRGMPPLWRLKQSCRGLLAMPPVQGSLLGLVRFFEQVAPTAPMLPVLYRTLLATNMMLGV